MIRSTLGLVFAALALAACGSDEEPSAPRKTRFVSVAAEVGLDFQHARGGTSKRHIFETMGGGAALRDFDGDGRLDVFVVDGADSGQGNRLFLQEDGRFVDRTEGSGLERHAIGMGCITADYDADGDVDLYVLEYGPNRLYRNEGDGRFVDVTEEAGVVDEHWSVSACFVDIDEDGWLDLYVANYLDYHVETAHPCFVEGRLISIHCPPREYPGQPDSLFRNRGDGTFEDVSESSGIRVTPPGKGMGVVAFDYDSDGHQDLYVANDSVANFLFRGDGRGGFEEVARSKGAALSGEGNAEAGMGIAVGDYDVDGDFDLFVTNFMNETNTLYQNASGEQFRDQTSATGVGSVSRPFVGFGTFFLDYDNDGWLDLFIANGHVDDNIRQYWPGITYAEPDLLLRGSKDGRFRNLSPESGDYFSERWVGRGASQGDIDRDGDLDLLVVNSGGPLVLLRNEGGSDKSWLRVELRGAAPNTEAIGAIVAVTSGDVTQRRVVCAGGSYASDSERIAHFGLGEGESVAKLEVTWPSGRKTVRTDVPARQVLVLDEPAEE